jgi:hypothetical protein
VSADLPVAHSSVQLGAVLKGLIAYKHVVLEGEAKLAALQRQHELVPTRAIQPGDEKRT